MPDRTIRREAALDVLPLLVPVVPFALVLGLAIEQSSVPNVVGWLGGPVIFGGAAQLTVVTLLDVGAAFLAVVTAGAVVNARHLMYSAALAPRFATQPRWFRWVAPYFLVDQMFALVVVREDEDSASFRRYYLTGAAIFWTVWQVTLLLGFVIGPVVPEAWALEFAVPLLFLGLTVTAVRDRPALVAALVGGGVAYLTIGLPNRVGMIIGGMAGVAAGTLAALRAR